MKSDKRLFVPILIIACASLLVILPSMLSGWPVTHEVFRYAHLLNHFTEAFEGGILYPRWMPNLFGGYGYPTFVFYQPGLFFLALPFRLITGNAFTALHIVVFLSLVTGGTGIFLTCRKITGKLFLSTFAALFYLATPYIYVDLYVRGNLSELVAMQFCSWPILFMFLLKDKVANKKSCAGYIGLLTLFLTAIIYTHPAVSLFFFPVFTVSVICYFLFSDKKNYLFLGYCAFSIVFSIVLSSPYWFPVMSLKTYVSPERALNDYYVWEYHFVYLSQFFSNKWAFGESLKGISGDGISFQLGLFHFTAAIAGIIIGRKNKFILANGVLYLFLIFLMTDYSSFLWRWIPILKYVQFPWRILSITALIQIICLCGISSLKIKPKVFKTIIVLFFVASLFFHIDQFFCEKWNAEHSELLDQEEVTMRNSYHPLCSNNELLPKTVTQKPPPPRTDDWDMVEVPDYVQIQKNRKSEYIIDCLLLADKNADVIINQVYLPGWKLYLNGTEIENSEVEGNLEKDGRMKLMITKGENQVSAYYDGPPGYIIRNICIIFFLISYFLLCIKEKTIIELREANKSSISINP